MKSLFRVLDSNNNGLVESIELASFLTDFINAFATMVEKIIEEIEPIIETTVKQVSRIIS